MYLEFGTRAAGGGNGLDEAISRFWIRVLLVVVMGCHSSNFGLGFSLEADFRLCLSRAKHILPEEPRQVLASLA